MLITLVVAVADNGVIGRDGGLPWRLSSDLKTFRRLTMGKPLIMGRRTFHSLKKPLVRRAPNNNPRTIPRRTSQPRKKPPNARNNIGGPRDETGRPAGAIPGPSF